MLLMDRSAGQQVSIAASVPSRSPRSAAGLTALWSGQSEGASSFPYCLNTVSRAYTAFPCEHLLTLLLTAPEYSILSLAKGTKILLLCSCFGGIVIVSFLLRNKTHRKPLTLTPFLPKSFIPKNLLLEGDLRLFTLA